MLELYWNTINGYVCDGPERIVHDIAAVWMQCDAGLDILKALGFDQQISHNRCEYTT